MGNSPGVKRFIAKQTASLVRRLTGKPTLYDAKKFVSTDDFSGRMQADILFSHGAVPTSNVLEVGCGCLSAGQHLIAELDPGRYVGIEPNEWLIETVLRKRPKLKELVDQKKPLFLANLEFDAAQADRQFDYVLSHSILSHAAHWQLPLFLKNVGAVLAPGGQIFASLILAEGNEYGNTGTVDKQDSMDAEWVYPGVSYFRLETVHGEAEKAGLVATLRHDISAAYSAKRPLENHDWFQFTRRA